MWFIVSMSTLPTLCYNISPYWVVENLDTLGAVADIRFFSNFTKPYSINKILQTQQATNGSNRSNTL